MKPLDENMHSLYNMSAEMIKYTKRIMQVTVELLSSDKFSGELYGESIYIEEELDQYQIRIDEKAVEAIARFQPAAADLRMIIGIMRINTDLERIGDHCISIVKTIKRAFKDKGENEVEMVSLRNMAEKVMSMYELFLNGFITKKFENGYIIIGLDGEIDDLKERHIVDIKEEITTDVSKLDLGIENLLISRNYERIADQITNLGEGLIYIYKGEDLRHKKSGEYDEINNR